jgi:ATP-dependent DNA ligase
MVIASSCAATVDGSAASPATATTGPTASLPSSKTPLTIKLPSFLIDGEAVVLREDGTYEFNALRNRGRGGEVMLIAFDLPERRGVDLREQRCSTASGNSPG